MHKALAPMMRHKYKLLGLAGFAAVGFALFGASMANEKPGTLSLRYGSHVTVPAVNRMVLNNRTIVSRSLKGRHENSPVEYLEGQGDALNFTVAWYDILNKQAYTAQFSVSASELSRAGALPHIATVEVMNGPGGDVVVTTLNAEVAKLLGKGTGQALPSPEQAPDIILRKICAQPLPPENALAVELAAAATDPDEQEQLGYDLRSRDSYLSEHPMPQSRCAENGAT